MTSQAQTPDIVEEDDDSPTLATRIAESIAALVLGVAVGGIGTFAHQLTWSDLAVPVPLGLVAALAAVAALLAGIRIVFDSRLYSIIAALGAVGSVGILALPGANGSVLLPDNALAVIWAVGPTVIAVVVLAWPRLPEPAPLGQASGSEPLR